MGLNNPIGIKSLKPLQKPFIMNPFRFGGVTPFSNDTGLKAYWKFDQASGDIINVSQAAADLGTAADLQVNGALYEQTGISANDKSLLFDGINDQAQAGTSTSQFNFLHNPNNIWTINFWLKYGGDTAVNNILDSNGGGGTARVGTVIEINADESIKLSIFLGTPLKFVINFDSSASFVPSDNLFHFYCLRWNQNLATDNLLCSIDDGTPEKQNKTAETPSSADSSYPLNMAAYANNYGAWLAGNLTEFSIFNRFLTDSEVTELYNGGNGLAIY
jgi:hypothetical protein